MEDLKTKLIEKISFDVNCFSAVILDICKEFGVSPELIYLIGIGYYPEKEKVWQRIEPRYSMSPKFFLLEYLGIEIIQYKKVQMKY